MEGLFHEDEIDGGDDAEEGGKVIPMQAFALEHHVGNDGKHQQGDALLQHFELHKRERTSVACKPNAICRYLAAIFKEGDGPREEYHGD